MELCRDRSITQALISAPHNHRTICSAEISRFEFEREVYRHTGLASLLSLRVVEVSNWAMRSSIDGAFSIGLRVGDELRVKPFEESCTRGEEEAEVVVVDA
jgi:hypothetical protein